MRSLKALFGEKRCEIKGGNQEMTTNMHAYL